MNEPTADLTRYAVISPHLDDGIFSCGQLLAALPGGMVITAFAGRPGPEQALTLWDSAGGFDAGCDVVAARRAEDRAALDVLAATPVWLDFCDRQYGQSASIEALARGIETALKRHRVQSVLLPLGLHHRDHRRLHSACLSAMQRDRCARDWFIYEDAIYRRYAGLVTQKLSELEILGVRLERIELPAGPLALKRAAVECYTTQLKALSSFGSPGYADVFEAEVYWRVQAG